LAPGIFFAHFIPFIQVPHSVSSPFNLCDASSTSGTSCLWLQASHLLRKCHFYTWSNIGLALWRWHLCSWLS